jgi:hypothetical protein
MSVGVCKCACVCVCVSVCVVVVGRRHGMEIVDSVW